MRMHFDSLFATNNGMVTPKVPISIGGVSFGPGVGFSVNGVSFGNVSISQMVGKWLEVQVVNGVHVITAVY
jgi:hypothetical protein